MTLAIFDLDNTLINGDSDHAWGEFLLAKGIVEPEVYQQANDHFYQQYQQGGLNIDEYLAFALAPLTRFTLAELDNLHGQFMRQVITPMLLDKAKALLNKHRQQGHFLLIITATNRFVTAPIADLLGVDDLLASDAEIIDGRYTGKVEGIPCFQHGKVQRLQQWLLSQPHSLEGSYFYSDSHNDLALLNLVDHPVAVDGDERLNAEAKAKGWPMISLRD